MSQQLICITGCSSGFGCLIAVAAAREHQVIATVRSEAGKAALLAACDQAGVSVECVFCDVTQRDHVTALMTHIKQHYGALDVLINNAGCVVAGFFEDLDHEQCEQVIQTNVMGIMQVTREALPLLRQRNSSKIIMISSIAGLVGMPAMSVYNASKFAVEGFSEALQYEVKPFGIEVVLLEPGTYNTQIFAGNLKVGARTFTKTSPYYTYSKRAFALLESRKKKGLKHPGEVVRCCMAIIAAKQPRFRYLLGNDARVRLYLRRILPFEWYRKLVMWILAKKMNSR